MNEDFDIELRRRLERLAGAVPVEPSMPATVPLSIVRARPTTRRLVPTTLVSLLAVAFVSALAAGLARIGPFASPSTGQTAAATQEVNPTETPTPPVIVGAVREGVAVTLTLDHDRVTAGQQIHAQIKITNLGSDPVVWASGGCGLMNGLSLKGPPVPQPPAGRQWTGTAFWAKWSATDNGIELTPFLDPRVVARGQFDMPCLADFGIDKIPGDESRTVDAVWLGVASDGTPAPGGAYSLEYSFPFLGRGVPTPDAQSITVGAAFDVDAVDPVAIPSTLAFDAALADPQMAAWISGVTRAELDGGSVRLERGLWFVRIRTQGGDAEVRVDPADGHVIGVVIG